VCNAVTVSRAPTLSLALISNDSAENMAQCLASVAGHVDEVVVADTGMDTSARNACVQYGANVFQCDKDSHPALFFHDTEEDNKQWGGPPAYSGDWALGDFAGARNVSFEHATCDYVCWIDADDVLENPEHLRHVVADMDTRGLGFGFLAYNYAQDHLGRVYYRQWRERIFKRGTAKWHNPVHEVLMPTTTLGPPGRYESPVYSHKRKADRKGIPHRNYKILLRQAWQLKTQKPNEPLDPRILFYLGQEARFIEPHKAVGFYEEYLQTSGWPEERAAAHVAIGSMLEYGVLGLPQAQAFAQADREFAAAACEMPDNPDGLFGLARIAYLRQRHQDCVNYSERAFKIGNTDSMLGANPMDRTYRPHIFYNHSLSKLGRLEEAIKSCEAGLAVMPDDPGVPGGAPGMLKHNIEVYRAELKKRAEAETSKVPTVSDGQKPSIVFDKNEDVDAPPAHGIPRDAMVIWAMQLWKQVVASGDYIKARQFLESLPSTVTSDPVVARMFDATTRRARRLPHPGKTYDPMTMDIVFYLGPGPEPWTPNTPNEKGLGGSETAAIEMARELGKLGHRCVVYAEAMGTFDGVEYRHHSVFKGAECDVFIASRTPWIAEQYPIRARLKLLWVHDIHCGPPSPQMERWLYKFDRVLCLSNWHRDYFLGVYPSLHPGQVVVTRNGIDPKRFATVPAKQNRLVFSSSPNRGLTYLLANLPAVRARVPDVHLDIFYGFDTWETFARQRGAQNELDEIANYKRLIDDAVKTGAVTWHGKRPQSEVAAAYLRAKVWSYPTDFPETHCITALEAQAAGAVPVTSKYAALAETVKHGFLVEPGPQYGQQWVDHAVHMLTDEQTRSVIAEKARAWALTQSWEALARDWSAMFDRLVKDVADMPIPLWKAA
jgi:glycosyltransferase involved in cell wall biosynthesis